MIQFAQIFNDEQIVVSLIRQLTWTHFIALIPVKDELQRDFYAQMCRIEGWSVSMLRNKIDSMLYKELLKQKLHVAIELTKKRFENNDKW